MIIKHSKTCLKILIDSKRKFWWCWGPGWWMQLQFFSKLSWMLKLLWLNEKHNKPKNITMGCSCTAVFFWDIAFFGQGYFCPPPPGGLRWFFFQSQETVFIALRTRGKDNRPKNRSLKRKVITVVKCIYILNIKKRGRSAPPPGRIRVKIILDIFKERPKMSIKVLNLKMSGAEQKLAAQFEWIDNL